MTTFEDLYNDRLAGDLHYLLAKRLKLNRTFNNVELSTKKKELVIKWFDPKVPAPKGEVYISEALHPLHLRCSPCRDSQAV